MGSSLSNVLLKDFSVMGRRGRLATFNTCTLLLAFLAFVGMTFLFFVPERFYPLLFGKIEVDRQIFLLLSASIFIRFVVSPLTMVLPAIGRVGLEAVWKLPSFLILAVFVIFVCDRSVEFYSIRVPICVFGYSSVFALLYALLTVAKTIR